MDMLSDLVLLGFLFLFFYFWNELFQKFPHSLCRAVCCQVHGNCYLAYFNAQNNFLIFVIFVWLQLNAPFKIYNSAILK